MANKEPSPCVFFFWIFHLYILVCIPPTVFSLYVSLYLPIFSEFAAAAASSRIHCIPLDIIPLYLAIYSYIHPTKSTCIQRLYSGLYPYPAVCVCVTVSQSLKNAGYRQKYTPQGRTNKEAAPFRSRTLLLALANRPSRRLHPSSLQLKQRVRVVKP